MCALAGQKKSVMQLILIVVLLKYLFKGHWNFKSKLENVKNMAFVSIGNYSVIQQQYIIATEDDFKPLFQYIYTQSNIFVNVEAPIALVPLT